MHIWTLSCAPVAQSWAPVTHWTDHPQPPLPTPLHSSRLPDDCSILPTDHRRPPHPTDGLLFLVTWTHLRETSCVPATWLPGLRCAWQPNQISHFLPISRDLLCSCHMAARAQVCLAAKSSLIVLPRIHFSSEFAAFSQVLLGQQNNLYLLLNSFTLPGEKHFPYFQ
uniref:Uncharacterized protein n=1 Tax=Callithrix jacchus TaxID=9483 RepID=A0A8I3WIJ9_CALJA